MLCEYLGAHGFSVSSTTATGNPADIILQHAQQVGAEAIAMGAHAVAKWRQMAFGSTTATLLDRAAMPLFLFH